MTSRNCEHENNRQVPVIPADKAEGVEAIKVQDMDVGDHSIKMQPIELLQGLQIIYTTHRYKLVYFHALNEKAADLPIIVND